jgi:hypothetical protein
MTAEERAWYLSRRRFAAAFAAGACAGAVMTACSDGADEERPLGRIWSTYSKVESLEADFRDMKQHGIEVVEVRPEKPEDLALVLNEARRAGLQLAIAVPDVTKSGQQLRKRGLVLPEAVMIGGVYQGKAIDRHLFRFAPHRHSILIEPPVYNRQFAYTKGSKSTGPRAAGDPIGHYFPDMPAPLRAEVVVPLRHFDGKQHLKIVPATVEVAAQGARLRNDSVAEDFPASPETRDRTIYQLTFDLSGMDNALLDKVGIAVYWPYRGTDQYWIFGKGTVSAAAPETREAMQVLVREEVERWAAAAGGSFPSDIIRALRAGDECFYITGGVSPEAPAVNYPLWDYSDAAIEQFRARTGGLESPRTWGYAEIYGEEAYSWWLYLLHDNAASILRAAREELDRIAPSVRLYRNSTRFGVFHISNDHDGSGQELIAAATDMVHLDPYPVNAAGYQPVIPRDMSYCAGLARRYKKPLLPWMQAHTYGGPTGLQDVTPEQVQRMVAEQRSHGVDGLMWLGYGKTFPQTRPDSWAMAAQLHQEFVTSPPKKPKVRLAVLRSYAKRALWSVTDATIRNPADWLLQQFLEVWAVEEGLAYDVFEIPPSPSPRERKELEEQLERYEFVVGTMPHPRGWLIGEGTDLQEIFPAAAEEVRRVYRAELLQRGWIRPAVDMATGENGQC